MRKYVIVSFLSMVFFHLSAQDCALTNTAFQKGEELKYEFSYQIGAVWFNAGEAKLSVNEETKDKHSCYHIVGKGTTYRTYDLVFKVRDVYESFIDVNTLKPVQFIRNIDEGGYRLKQYVFFNTDPATASSAKKTLSITACTHDVLSAVYYLRNTDMSHIQIGQIIPITVYIDDSLFYLTVQYQGKEKLTTHYGTFNTLKLKPLTIKGTIFKDSDHMIVWVSDDANHIPIAVSSPILIGEIRADLINAKGLRYPLNGTIQ